MRRKPRPDSLEPDRFELREAPPYRFEWTRQEFQDWANRVAARFGYAMRFFPVGPEHPEFGSPTQMAVFTR